jgi:hypothetical protein
MLGIGLFVGFPSVSAHSDLATFLSGINRGGERWRVYMTRSPAGSLHEVEMVFNDPITTGAIADGAGIAMPGGGQVSLTSAEKQADPRTDEDRVNRRDKKGRIIAVAPVTPPKDFTAGSILQRTSSLTDPLFDAKERMVFSKPQIRGKEIQIATAFYKKKAPKIDSGMSPMLASLVTNQAADVLAAAYAPAEPDYARDIAGGSRLGGQSFAGDGLFRGRAEMPDLRHLFRIARRIAQRSGGGRAGHSQPRPQSGLSRYDLRRRLPEQGLVQSLPVLVCLRPHSRHRLVALQLAGSQGSRPGSHRRQDLASGSRFRHALPCDLREARLGSDHEAGLEDRQAHLLPHLRRRMELKSRGIQDGRSGCGHQPSRQGAAIPRDSFAGFLEIT